MAAGANNVAPAAPSGGAGRPSRGRRRLRRLLSGRPLFAVLACLGALVVGAGVAAAMAARSPGLQDIVRPVVSFSSGVVRMGNSSSGSAIVSRSKMLPGDAVTGQVVISNRSRKRAKFYLYTDDLIDVPGPYGGLLSQKLVLRVMRVRGSRRVTVYDGVFAGLKSVSLGRFGARERRRYAFTVTFPHGASATDDRYMASSMSVQFDWSTRRKP